MEDEKKLTGRDLVEYIRENNLEDAIVTVTATMYYNGDHDCITTDNVSVSRDSMYIGKGKSITTIDFYVDNNLY